MTDADRLIAYDAELSSEMPADMKDWWRNSRDEWPIVARLVLQHRRENLEECRTEVERLRLTDEERAAVARAADWLARWQDAHGYHSEQSADLATLRSMLRRQQDTPAAHTTPREGSEQDGCTLTGEEREAVEWCVEMAVHSATDCADEIATLRGLLERL